MSQFRIRKGESLYLYGYDNPLQEFFFIKFDKEGEVVFSIANHMTSEPHEDFPNKFNFSNGEILEIVNEELGNDAPENFTLALTLDLPI